jgi:hypothetical protein
MLFICFRAAVGLLLVRVGQCQSSPLSVEANKGFPQQSLVYSYWLKVDFDHNFYDPGTNIGASQIATAVKDAVTRGKWDCHSPLNYKVTIGGRTANVVRVYAGALLGQDSKCETQFGGDAPGSLVLLLGENRVVSLSGMATVEILGVKYQSKALKLTGSASKSVAWTATILTLAAQEVTNENLNNKTIDQKGVFQFPISASYNFWPQTRGGGLVESKDLFSTNERDTQSAFMGGVGYQQGLSGRWYLPLKFEQELQGNQVATNLSAVSIAQLNASMPFVLGTNWGLIDAPIPATISLGFPYTHRINQLIASGSKPLPTNDFAINPALALTGGRLLYWTCKPSGGAAAPVAGGAAPAAGAGKYPGLCLNWEADLGLWYLPLEETKKGSQRAEGYWVLRYWCRWRISWEYLT